jgi:NAD(P)-dependent dehydrogenase (short-subunit alcohol dehydrogenase family)
VTERGVSEPVAGPGAGRAVLITGCSSGIGRCAAEGLRDRGYRVLATARRAGDVDALRAQGFEAFVLDLADEASVAEGARRALADTGGALYALFNNGAYGQPGAVEDLGRAVLRAQFETNLFGSHQLTCAVLPAMRARGTGRIVQNSSVLGLVALRYRGAYNASKFALEGLSDTLRMELAGTGIHVSLIEPGPVTSRFRDNARAAFHAHIDVEASPHRALYRRFARRLDQDDDTPFTRPPEAVLARLVHALEARRPRARYFVTLPTHALGFLRRVLPTRALDAVLAAASSAENR